MSTEQVSRADEDIQTTGVKAGFDISIILRMRHTND